MKHLCEHPIALTELLQGSDHQSGAGLLFTGTVRNHHAGRAVRGMSYTAHHALAEAALETICRDAETRFDIASCRIIHRLGELQLGDISVAILVHSAHREAAYEASRWAIETLKQKVPIWKQEHYVDGADVYLDGTTLDQAL